MECKLSPSCRVACQFRSSCSCLLPGGRHDQPVVVVQDNEVLDRLVVLTVCIVDWSVKEVYNTVHTHRVIVCSLSGCAASPHTGSPLSMTWWWGRTCWPSILRKGRCGRWTVKSCQFMSQPLLLCEACYPGGRGFNSCDQGQLGVHRQHEAGGAGGGEGEEETEGEEERRYYGEY